MVGTSAISNLIRLLEAHGVRVDYRVFTLRGNPQHKNIQRIYAGLNLAF